MTPAKLKHIRDDVLELGRGQWAANAELAGLLGVSYESVRRYLSGERKIRTQVVASVMFLTLVKLLLSEEQWGNTIKTAMAREWGDLAE
jgi:hypothetical protein